jgi:hypothetical protein
MFLSSNIIIEAFVKYLNNEYWRAFPGGEQKHCDAISRSARMVLPHIARSNAPYHNLSHTILVVQIGQHLLTGRKLQAADVSSVDWMHFVVSTLCFAVGFVRNACPGDDGRNSCVVNADGKMVTVPRGVTDGWLWPYFTDRSKIFVTHHFRNDPLIDPQTLCANIEYSRFPPAADRNLETTNYPGLLRAAHLIGSVADPDFILKTQALMLELEESGMSALLGYSDVATFRLRFVDLFWNTVYPLVAAGMKLLNLTGEGRELLTHLHAQLLAARPHAKAG